MHGSPHVLAPSGQLSFISPSPMNQPDVCFCSQPLNQSSFALFSLDCTGLLLSALWSSLPYQLELLVLSSQLFPLNPSMRFLSTSAQFPVSLLAGLSFLFPYPVFSLYLLSSWDTARKICQFVYVPALGGRVRPCMCGLLLQGGRLRGGPGTWIPEVQRDLGQAALSLGITPFPPCRMGSLNVALHISIALR